jgi:hypothetical protein
VQGQIQHMSSSWETLRPSFNRKVSNKPMNKRDFAKNAKPPSKESVMSLVKESV